ncbi:hypothetical protein TI05_01725 [Achromatium sp. WMS3]|nr:hypothetical protein TI05_01725 [Achromatium sp. WMS3]
MRFWYWIVCVLTLFWINGQANNNIVNNSTQPLAYVLPIEGIIGPATSDYIEKSLTQAENQRAALVIISLDTPGGLDTAMRMIIKRILAATIPVVAYVAPSGARAASAGTYILYASHIAAMAPGTNLGAATPVKLTSLSDPNEGSSESTDNSNTNMPVDAHKAKMVNDAVAYIQSLAKLRNRNIVWAEQAVRTAASLPAEQALREGVVDLLADNLEDLLQNIDGRVVNLPHKKSHTLRTAGLNYKILKPDWGIGLLMAIGNPTIAYILLLLGIYGLIYEFANPGALLPGTTGAIFLLLAFYALQMLPVDYAGLAFVILGLILMIAETFLPSFGALGIGGIIAFIFGSLILIDTSQGVPGISLSLVISLAIVSVILILTISGLALKSQRRPIVSGAEELSNALGTVINNWDSNEGVVRIRGELWSAKADVPLKHNQTVKVIGRTGLILSVTPEIDSKI